MMYKDYPLSRMVELVLKVPAPRLFINGDINDKVNEASPHRFTVNEGVNEVVAIKTVSPYFYHDPILVSH